jgi:hypothetical protein
VSVPATGGAAAVPTAGAASVTAAGAAAPPAVPGAGFVIPPPTTPGVPVTEAAVTNRIVALLTPFIGIAAAWVAGWIARKIPGVKIDQGALAGVMISAVVLVLGVAWKWLQGWQQHELLVAQKLAAPIKPVVTPVLQPAPGVAAQPDATGQV